MRLVHWFKRYNFVALLWLACASIATAAPASPSAETKQTPANVEALKAQIQKILHDTKTPGAAIALVRKDGPEWIGALGFADVAANKPATEDTLFRVGSISKMFVALSALKLQHEGKLDLQDTLRSRAPDLVFSNPWEATDPVRIVNLLEHTAGWFDFSFRETAYESDHEPTLQEGLAFSPASRTSRWRPGTRVAYTNEGPPAAAYVIEKITNQRFEDYVGENWFKPLRMGTANFFDTPEVQSRLAKQYRSDGNTTFPYWHILLRPAGSLNASVKEMANFVQFFLNRGTFEGVQLLPPEAIDRMERPLTNHAARDGMVIGYGLNNYTTIQGGRVWHGHSGGVRGSLAEFRYLPEAGIGYVFMINSPSGKAVAQISDLIQAYLTQSLPTPVLAPPAKTTVALAREYSGWYEPISPRSEPVRYQERLLGLTRISVTASALTMKPLFEEKRVFVPVNDRLFRREKDPVAQLALISEHTDGTLVQVDRFLTLRRIPLWMVWTEILIPVVAILLAAGSVIFALIWLPRKVFGQLKTVKYLSVRALPLLAILSIAVTQITMMRVGDRGVERIGHMTPWSVTIMLSTIAYALFSVLGLVHALRHYRSDIRRMVWWHSFATSLFLTLVATYLAYWGMIGYRSWV